jgi:L-threonylcarbamoyladenylate synthase
MSLSYDCADPVQRETGLAAAADAVRRGDLVVLPTDTVYGLGADAFTPLAVDALLAAKGRGRDVPVPVLVGSWRALDGLALVVPAAVRELVEAFWPGGLTLVVEHAPSLAWDLGETRGTVAVRMPLHPVALELLAEIGPMAVSSANRSGQPPATTAAEARDQLGHSVAVYLDSGRCGDPVPSTIVDVTGPVPQLLRPGAVSLDQLREVNPAVQPVGEAAPSGPGRTP